MMKVNPNEAPEGYIAIETASCDGCALDAAEHNKLCYQADCSEEDRKDECNVIFIKKSPEFMPQHTDGPNFQNELLKLIASNCGFITNNMNMQENIKEIEFFASKVFEAGVEFGKQANKEIH